MSFTFESTSSLDPKTTFVFQNEIYTNTSEPIVLSPTPASPSHSSRHHFWRDTWDDLKSTRWRCIFKRFGSHFLPLLSMSALIVLIVRLLQPWPMTLSACTPDGTFHIGTFSQFGYNPWQQPSMLAINLAFGNMDFATAKGIDILWDVGFGRGMQGLLGIVSYKACTKALSRLMESRPVTSRTFEAVALQGDSFFALCKLIRDLLSNGGARAKFVIMWIATSMLFLLSFQTITSAMTGYSAKLGGFILINSGERVPADLFEAVQYIIHDGSRLGGSFYDDYPITIPSVGGPSLSSYSLYTYTMYPSEETVYYMSNQCQYFAPLNYYDYTKGVPLRWKSDESGVQGFAKCTLMWHVSEYVSRYGFLGLNDTSSVFNNTGTMVNITSPALNISAYFGDDFVLRDPVPWSSVPYGYTWKTPDGQYPFRKPNAHWVYSESFLTLDELNSKGTCQQKDSVDIKYQWGFSATLLLIFTVLLFVWMLGTYAMYLDAYFNSKLDADGRDLGLKRAVFDLHSEMTKEVDPPTIEHLGNSQVNTLIPNGRIDYRQLVTADTNLTTRNAQLAKWRQDFDTAAWLKHEIWWLTALLVLTVFFILSYTNPRVARWWNPVVAPLPWFGTVLVIAAGRAHKSRWIIFVVLFAVFWGWNGTVMALMLR